MLVFQVLFQEIKEFFVQFLYPYATAENEPYKPVPMCSCRRYSKDDSGLAVILMVGGTPKVIVPTFNRLYWHWLFYGDVWTKENLVQENEIQKPCGIEGIPKSTGNFYNPEHVLSYLMENFERINTYQQKEIQKRTGILGKIITKVKI